MAEVHPSLALARALDRCARFVALRRRARAEADLPQVARLERLLREAFGKLGEARERLHPGGVPQRARALDLDALRGALGGPLDEEGWRLFCLDLLVALASLSGDPELSARTSVLGVAIALGRVDVLARAAALVYPWGALASVAEHASRGEELLARALAAALLAELERGVEPPPRLTRGPNAFERVRPRARAWRWGRPVPGRLRRWM